MQPAYDDVDHSTLSSNRPFFIVGSPRSGTTLMRAILDNHPRLAVPTESHFVVGLAPNFVPWSPRGARSVDDILSHHKFKEWDVDPEHVRAYVSRRRPRSYAELITSVFEAYAVAHGKVRWGDKTPGYVSYMPLLGELFPRSLFIHMIRDGRDVAASLSERSWGTRTAISGAFWWRRKVRKGRRDGKRLAPDRYTEVRLEDLIEDPETVIRAVCEFIGEDYVPDLLDYHLRQAATELGPDVKHIAKPPTAGLRDWRQGRSRFEQRAIESVCRPVLKELGYGDPARDIPARVFAQLVWGRDLLIQGPAAVKMRLKPASRAF